MKRKNISGATALLIGFTISGLSHFQFTFAEVTPVASGDWPIWRGPTRNGIAEEGQTPPIKWTAKENVIWETSIPGRGHSSPMIQGNRLFLTTAREDVGNQSVLCYDVTSGKPLWETVVFEGKLPKRIHKKNTHASPSVACAGNRIFAVFFAGEDVYLIALDLEGKELWRKKTGRFVSEWSFGYGASPVLAGDLVVVVSDSKNNGYIAAYHQETGKEEWRTPREADMSSYGTPVLAEIQGKTQILLSGSGTRVVGYDPSNGTELWSITGGVPLTAATVVWKDDIVYASGGYPGKQTWATNVKTRKVIWKNKTKCYEQSLLIVDDHLYGVAEGGVMHCWALADGEMKWRTRLPGGQECASPILAGGNIYHANEEGKIFVIKPNPERLELVQENRLGDEIFATPTICRNRIFIRTAVYRGSARSETLYCIGKP